MMDDVEQIFSECWQPNQYINDINLKKFLSLIIVLIFKHLQAVKQTILSKYR